MFWGLLVGLPEADEGWAGMGWLGFGRIVFWGLLVRLVEAERRLGWYRMVRAWQGSVLSLVS